MMQFIKPTWPAPENICAYTTTRQRGNSLDPYASFNLAQHVGDNELNVQRNRQMLLETLDLPSNPIWLQQTHSTKVVTLVNGQESDMPIADAAITTISNKVCTVMTADCLPLLLCNRGGTLVSAIHAGWRGLANGIIENTINAMNESPSELLAWMGPAIGPEAFEVSQDVLESFITHDQHAKEAFKVKTTSTNKWLANIYLLAKKRLSALGVTAIYGGDYCTFSDEKNFYSYRRDGITGRMATLIWLSTKR